MKNKALILAAIAMLAAPAFGQNATQKPQFDAASVRVNRTPDRAFTQYDAGRVILHKASIKHMIRRAWPIPDYQVVWPSWVDAARGAVGYDVSVTFPADTSAEKLQLMFQDLLATRFGLVMHWETRDVKAFEVGVSDKGFKLKEAANPAPPTDYPKYSTHNAKGEWTLSSKLGTAPSGLSVDSLLEAINQTRIVDRPLVDATGIKGIYDFDLTAPSEVPDNKPAQSELLSALDKQAGLKATAKTLSMKVLVIDRLEQIPTEN